MTLILHLLCITRMPSKLMRASRAWKTTRRHPRSRQQCLRRLPRRQPQEQAPRCRLTNRRLTLGPRSTHPALHLHPRLRKRRKQRRCILTMTMIHSITMRLKASLLLNHLAHRCLRNPSRPQRLLQVIKHHPHPVGHLQRHLDHHGPPRRSPWTFKERLVGGDPWTDPGHRCLWNPDLWLMKLTWLRIRTGGLHQMASLLCSKVDETYMSNRRNLLHPDPMVGHWQRKRSTSSSKIIHKL